MGDEGDGGKGTNLRSQGEKNRKFGRREGKKEGRERGKNASKGLCLRSGITSEGEETWRGKGGESSGKTQLRKKVGTKRRARICGGGLKESRNNAQEMAKKSPNTRERGREERSEKTKGGKTPMERCIAKQGVTRQIDQIETKKNW